ncbi:MAG: hypothetical protein MHM6MM_002903 [Cercozoa sp. M6MM]
MATVDGIVRDFRLCAFAVAVADGTQTDKEGNHPLLLINGERGMMQTVARESVTATISFSNIMSVVPNVQFNESFSVYMNDGNTPVTVTLESSIDRDECVQLLRALLKIRNTEEGNPSDLVPEVVYEGPTRKRSGMSWKERWLVLLPTRLLCFRSRDAHVPINVLSLYKYMPAVSGSHKRTVKLTHSTKNYLFKFATDENRAVWSNALSESDVRCSDIVGCESVRLRNVDTEDRADISERLREILALAAHEAGHDAADFDEDDSTDAPAEVPPPPPDASSLVHPEEDFGAAPPMLTAFNRRAAESTKVFSWGQGSQLQLCNGSSRSFDDPQPVGALSDGKRQFVDLCCATSAPCAFAVSRGGKVYSWGTSPLLLGLGVAASGHPRVSAGTPSHISSFPGEMPFVSMNDRVPPAVPQRVRIGQVVAGERHALALAAGPFVGATESRVPCCVFAWGDAALTGLARDVHSPTPLRFLAKTIGEPVTRVSAHASHSLALSASGHVYSWGLPGPWLGGDTTMQGETCHVAAVDVAERVRSVACGREHSVAVTSSGSVYSWGSSPRGQCGHGDTRTVSVPKVVRALSNQLAAEVVCGDEHTAVLTRSGRVFVFGSGDDGRLGLDHMDDELSPVAVAALSGDDFALVACSQRATFCVNTRGAAVACGHWRPQQQQQTGWSDLAGELDGRRCYSISGGTDFALALTQLAELDSDVLPARVEFVSEAPSAVPPAPPSILNHDIPPPPPSEPAPDAGATVDSLLQRLQQARALVSATPPPEEVPPPPVSAPTSTSGTVSGTSSGTVSDPQTPVSTHTHTMCPPGRKG